MVLKTLGYSSMASRWMVSSISPWPMLGFLEHCHVLLLLSEWLLTWIYSVVFLVRDSVVLLRLRVMNTDLTQLLLHEPFFFVKNCWLTCLKHKCNFFSFFSFTLYESAMYLHCSNTGCSRLDCCARTFHFSFRLFHLNNKQKYPDLHPKVKTQKPLTKTSKAHAD